MCAQNRQGINLFAIFVRMKPMKVIAGLLLLVLGVSCSRESGTTYRWDEESARIVLVDSLLQNNPDSAMLLLEDWHGGDLRSPDKDYVGLMLSEAAFKLLREVAYCDEVDAAMSYFDSVSSVFSKNKDMAFLAARAHYMNAICLNNGIIYEDDSTTMLACQQYYEAWRIMQSHFEEKEIVGHKASFMALVYARLANIYSDKFLINPTTFFYKEVLCYKQKANASPSSLANTLFFLGYEFEKAEEYDSALHYYEQSLDHIADTTGVLYRNVVNRTALASYQVNHDAANSIAALKHIAAAGKAFELHDRYLGIGYIYMLDHQYDSALVYLEKVYDEAPNLFLRTQSAEHLSEIYDQLGDSPKANAYARFVTQNTPPEFGTKADERRYNSLFDEFLEQHHEWLSAHAKRVGRSHALKLLAVFSIAFLALLYSLLAYRSRHKRTEAENEALSGQLKEHEEALTAMKKKVEAASFADEPIYRLIMERVNEGQFKTKVDYLVYKDFALSKDEVLALHEAADRHFDGFTSRLRKAYPSLTKGDIDYCCLYLLGLEEADIAALMQRAYNTVCDRSRKLKAVFSDDAPLAATVRGFANDC